MANQTLEALVTGQDPNDDGCVDIPWEKSMIAKGRVMTVLVACFGFVATALFILRKLVIERGGREDMRITLLFTSSLRSTCNGIGLVLQVTLLSRILYDLRAHCYTAEELDMYYFSLIMVVVEYLTEILVRRTMSKILFLHHMITLSMITVFVSENDPYTDTLSPFVNFSTRYPLAWKGIVGMAASFGLLSTSSVFLDIPMCFYHKYKETKPVMVLNILKVGVVLNLFAKLLVHGNMWTVYGTNFRLLPPATRVLMPIAGTFFMIVEYYLVFISIKITQNHKNKRVDGMAKSSLPTTTSHTNGGDSSDNSISNRRKGADNSVEEGSA